MLVVAAEDYTGKSPNVTAGYDTAPRYLAQHVAALEAAGYEVETFNVDAPPANGGSPNGVVRPQIKYPTYLGVLSHFDAVNYYSGDDFAPQDADQHQPAPPAPRRRRRPARRRWRRGRTTLMLELRDYANEGGKLVVDGRNIHQAVHRPRARSLSRPARTPGRPTSCSASTTRTNNAGDDDLPGTAWQRSREISNDTWQNYLGVVGRQAGAGVTGTKFDTAPVTPKAGSLFEGMAPFTVDATAGNDPNQTADGTPLPLAKSPLRLRNWAASGTPTSRCARRRCRPTTPRPRPRHANGRRDHLDA